MPSVVLWPVYAMAFGFAVVLGAGLGAFVLLLRAKPITCEDQPCSR